VPSPGARMLVPTWSAQRIRSWSSSFASSGRPRSAPAWHLPGRGSRAGRGSLAKYDNRIPDGYIPDETVLSVPLTVHQSAAIVIVSLARKNPHMEDLVKVA
jgi:hypothetical protein